MRSLIREQKDKLFGWIFLSVGLLDYVVYFILYVDTKNCCRKLISHSILKRTEVKN